MSDPVAQGLEKAGAHKGRAHLFLCLGPECSSMEEGEKVWNFLKHRLAETAPDVMRTKAACLRVCAGGPWLVVYPDGIWYGGVTVERCGRIVAEHVLGGKPVAEWVAARSPVAPCEGRRG
jgi:(2Fe-2S) ferredoxin